MRTAAAMRAREARWDPQGLEFPVGEVPAGPCGRGRVVRRSCRRGVPRGRCRGKDLRHARTVAVASEGAAWAEEAEAWASAGQSSWEYRRRFRRHHVPVDYSSRASVARTVPGVSRSRRESRCCVAAAPPHGDSPLCGGRWRSETAGEGACPAGLKRNLSRGDYALNAKRHGSADLHTERARAIAARARCPRRAAEA